MNKNIFKLLTIILLSIGLNNFSLASSFESVILDDSSKVIQHQSIDGKTKDDPKKTKKPKKGAIVFETYELNYVKALKYYKNEQWLSAAKLFEELYPLSIGTPRADSVLFMFADCYYQNGDYEMASFHFKDYSRRYPGSTRAEEAYFMAVKSIYNVSPEYSLDQTETRFAIEEIGVFLSLYPHSNYMEDCNKMLDILRDKLAKKDFEILKLYAVTENYQAAQVAARNFLKEYSYSSLAPEAVLILVKNNYQYAKRSVNSRKIERYQACIDASEIMEANYNNSDFINDAREYANDAKKQINKIKNKN